jgi:hypothetical protein
VEEDENNYTEALKSAFVVLSPLKLVSSLLELFLFNMQLYGSGI